MEDSVSRIKIEKRIATAIYESLPRADVLPPTAFIGDALDFKEVPIDGTFDITIMASAVADAIYLLQVAQVHKS